MSAPQIQYPPTSGGGTPTGGSGTANTIPLWTGSTPSTTLTDSLLSQSGAIVTNSGTFRAADGTFSEPGYTFSGSSGSGMYRRSSGSILAFSSSGTFAFGVSSSQRMYIGTSATAVPTERLEVGGGIRVAGAANVATATASQPGVLSLEFPVTRIYTGDGTGYTFAISKRSGSVTTDMLSVVDNNGYVGIGTASPGYKLDVSGVINTTDQVRVFSSATSADVRLNAGFGGTVAGLGTVGAHPFMLFTSNVERARIDSNGNVGIGVTPISPLHVKGNATNTDGILTLTPNTAGRSHQVQSLQASSLFRIFDQSAGASRLEIDINGNISAATTGGTFNASTTNAGIKLPATPGNTNPNTLDCYVDGGASAGGVSWTPTLSAAATWGGTAPTVTNARYTRIGNMVFCTVTLDTTGGVAFSSTYGSSTITAPAGVSAAVFTSVPSNRAGTSANGAQSGTTIYVPTYGSATTVINITWFYAV
jgi:hypothetical protein